jgi:hypothetical protein
MTGASVSLTVTVKVQVAVPPDGVVAVQLTVVVPFGKTEPDGGVQLIVTACWQASVAITVKFTTAEHCPGSVDVTMFAGQVIVGGGQNLK